MRVCQCSVHTRSAGQTPQQPVPDVMQRSCRHRVLAMSQCQIIYLVSCAKAVFRSFSMPPCTSAVPNRPVRVGYTESNMSAPSAEQIRMSIGYLWASKAQPA